MLLSNDGYHETGGLGSVKLREEHKVELGSREN